MRNRLFIHCVLCATALAFGAHAEAGDRAWGALVLARNLESPRVAPELETCMPAIERVFGYNSAEILGQCRHRIHEGGAEWLIPSEEFFMKLNFGERSDTAYAVEVELYRKKRRLLTAKVDLGREAPLYIKGPQCSDGQLIILLAIK